MPITPIPCNEGKLVEAPRTQGVDFGSVTSCMTITCLLDDGHKVAAHDAVFERVTPHIFTALKQKIGSRTVSKVLAAGAGSCWTWDMRSQADLSQTLAQTVPGWSQSPWTAQLKNMEGYLISRNIASFKKKLAETFGVSVDKVEYQLYDEGAIQVLSIGVLKVGN
jgi:hypothetical protein